MKNQWIRCFSQELANITSTVAKLQQIWDSSTKLNFSSFFFFLDCVCDSSNSDFLVNFEIKKENDKNQI